MFASGTAYYAALPKEDRVGWDISRKEEDITHVQEDEIEKDLLDDAAVQAAMFSDDVTDTMSNSDEERSRSMVSRRLVPVEILRRIREQRQQNVADRRAENINKKLNMVKNLPQRMYEKLPAMPAWRSTPDYVPVARMSDDDNDEEHNDNEMSFDRHSEDHEYSDYDHDEDTPFFAA